MPSGTQNYSNHGRWYPLYHFFVSPLSWLYALWAVWIAIRVPGATEIIHAGWAIVIATGMLTARVMAVTVQNRVIRFEMRQRLREVLPAPLVARIRELTTRQLIALRFAGDAELPSLVERTLQGEFARPRDIKRAVTDWQSDYLRA
jgi:hypothetical protein